MDEITLQKNKDRIDLLSQRFSQKQTTGITGNCNQSKPKYAYLSGTQLWANKPLMAALQSLGLEPRNLNAAFTNGTIDYASSVFVFDEFEGPIFTELCSTQGGFKPRIYGPPAIICAAESSDKTLPYSRSGHPIYCRILKDARVSTTGLKSKELYEAKKKILYMDGVYLERDGLLTHLVAGKCRGPKYRDAVELGRPIFHPIWIDYLWKNRNKLRLDVMRTSEGYKVKAFYGTKIYLEGFDPIEKAKIMKLIQENCGRVATTMNTTVTHVVVSNTAPREKVLEMMAEKEVDQERAQIPSKRPRLEFKASNDNNENKLVSKSKKQIKFVTAEWFWSSLQLKARDDEDNYLYQEVRQGQPDDLNNSFGNLSSFTGSNGNLSEADQNSSTFGTLGAFLENDLERQNFERQIQEGNSGLQSIAQDQGTEVNSQLKRTFKQEMEYPEDGVVLLDDFQMGDCPNNFFPDTFQLGLVNESPLKAPVPNEPRAPDISTTEKCLFCYKPSTTSLSLLNPLEASYLKTLYLRMKVCETPADIEKLKNEAHTVSLCALCRDQVVMLYCTFDQVMKKKIQFCRVRDSLALYALESYKEAQRIQHSAFNNTTDYIREKIVTSWQTYLSSQI